MTYFRDPSDQDLTPPEFRAVSPEVHHDPESFRDGFTIGAAFASSLALGAALIALGAAIYFGEF